MRRLGIDTPRLARRGLRSRRGSAILGTLVVIVALIGLVVAASTTSVVEVKDARRTLDGVRAKYLAEAGLERGINFLGQAAAGTRGASPLAGLTALFSAGATATPFVAEPLFEGASRVGAYTVSLNLVASTPSSITIAIDATGYVPDAPQPLPPGQEVSAWRAQRCTVQYSQAPSEVFDYAYFLNNWGWFYGNTIRANGNVRSNGQFDAAGYRPTITGQPLYTGLDRTGGTVKLSGYEDDNGDGLTDGNDGGIWSGWDIVRAQNVQGNGGKASNQHDFDAQIEMPNLSDLSQYEAAAIAQNGSIKVGSSTVCSGVLGDQPGEKQNLYLVGTAANPIVLNGPVVVRGDVVISGVVTGQGVIYSGRNVYCPKSVTYKNAPATPRPASNTQAATEAWLTTNWNKDFLGLFARENVVVGNYTNASWQAYVSQWMADPMNQSAEDAGIDGIPGTKNGRDGILGTADDDVLEGDGVFTVERYTDADAALGLIPPGKNVGDVIPGSGEDIDGDGVYDRQASMADIPVKSALKPANWAGNMPAAGIANYGTISSLNANRLDATFYTNHSFCWYVTGSTAAALNGALISRNENIIYGTPSITFNHDSRLLGRASGLAANWLPSTLQPMQVLRWIELDFDPNRYAVVP